MNLAEQIEREYNEVKENKTDKIIQAKSQNIDSLIDTYARWLGFRETMRFRDGILVYPANFHQTYSKYLLAFHELQKKKRIHTPSEITLFSMSLKQFENDFYFNKSGSFLQALINRHYAFCKKKKIKTDEYVLMLENLEKNLDHVGYNNNGACVRIMGNCGLNLGEDLQKGELILQGNCGDQVGKNMLGGKITIFGNAGTNVGTHMHLGEIHLQGAYDSIADVPFLINQYYNYGNRKPKIFHKGIQIYPMIDQVNT